MSRFFGPIRQNGFVVRDVVATMEHMSQVLGIGPFLYLEEAGIDDFHYRGVPHDLKLRMAFAHAGPLQIELIQPLGDTPCMYRDFLAAGHEGLQHLGYLVDDFDAAFAKGQERGWQLGQRGEMQGIRFAYFDTETHPGTVIEVIEGSAPSRAFYAMLEERARDWDGSDPIRRA